MITRFLQSTVSAVVLLVFAWACSLPPASTSRNPAAAGDQGIVPGREYFTRHTFMHEKGVHSATNYWRGTLVPINSRVHLAAIDADSMLLRLASGETVKVKNVPEYTRCDITTIAERMLSRSPVAMERLDRVTTDAIGNGVLRAGMTRTEVLMARGYPPAHETPSLEQDTWKYWSSRFVTQTVVFRNGVLAPGRDIQ